MKSNLITSVDLYLFYIFILLLPLFPYSQTAFALFSVLLLLVVKTIKMFLTKKITFSTGVFDIPIILIAATYIISALFITPSKMDAFIFPGTTSIIVIGSFLYFLTNQIDLAGKRVLKYFLFSGIVLYSVMILLISTKILPMFKPIDNYLLPTLYITSLIPIMINLFSVEKEFVYRFLIGVATVISIFAMVVAILVSPKPNLLPFNVSTTIATSSLKQNLIFGIGSGNFVNAFNKFRPFDFNQSEIWSIKFNEGSSFLITNLTEIGILGSITILALTAIYINFAINTTVTRKKVGWGILGSVDLLSVAIILIELALFQSAPIIIFTLFILFGLISDSKKHEYIMPNIIISGFITIPLLTLITLASLKIFSVTSAEYHYNAGLMKLSENKAKESFDSLKKSINVNSKVDRYHRAMSSIYFGIANSVSKKQDISESEKEQVTIFIQESINEGKAAVAINNKSSENWEFLGKTYHLLIPFTKGADIFAIESYKEAIALDPINPNLRIKLGEVYMIQKKYDDAIELFNLAILAKDDHPNAHFNLALAYKEKGEIEKAKTELDKTLELVDKENDKDYEMILKEINSLSTVQTQ